MRPRRIVAAIVLFGLLASLLLLAISVDGLQLLPGRPFNFFASVDPPPSGAQAVQATGDAILQVVRVILIGSAVLLPISILYALLSAEGRKKLIGNAMMAVSMVAVYLLALRAFGNRERELEMPPLVGTADPAEVIDDIPLDTFNAATPDWLVLAISLLCASILSIVLAVVIWRIWRSRRPVRATARDYLAQEAQNAIDTLQSGGELTDAILRCYQEMSRLLQQERGIQRKADMTAREFERALLAQKLPPDAVHQLTLLFEQVRYGHARMGQREEELALASLNAIVEACRRTKPAQGNA